MKNLANEMREKMTFNVPKYSFNLKHVKKIEILSTERRTKERKKGGFTAGSF